MDVKEDEEDEGDGSTRRDETSVRGAACWIGREVADCEGKLRRCRKRAGRNKRIGFCGSGWNAGGRISVR